MDTNATYMLRWRGRQQGPFSVPQIERKLSDNEIGMLHEIFVEGAWCTLRTFFERVDEERRVEAERVAAERAAVDRGGGAVGSPAGGRAGRTEIQQGEAAEPDGSDERRDGRIRAGDCIKRAWHLTLKNPVETIVGFLLYGFVSVVTGLLFSTVSSYGFQNRLFSISSHNPIVPALSIVALLVAAVVSVLCSGALLGGLWFLFLRVAQGRSGGLGDLFAGFRRKPLHLGFGVFISNVALMIVAALPWIIFAEVAALLLGASALSALASGQVGEIMMFFTGLFRVVAVILVLPVSLVLWSHFFVTRVMYVPALIVDKELSFFQASRVSARYASKQIWTVFGLVCLSALIASLGFLICGVGAVFTIPLALMSLAVAYTEIFDPAVIEQEVENTEGGANEKAATSVYGWLLRVCFVISVVLALALVVVTLANPGRSANPQGSYVMHSQPVDSQDGSLIKVPDRFVEFYSSSRCRAKLNVFKDESEDVRWKRTGDSIELLTDSGSVVSVFRYDSREDKLVLIDGGKELGPFEHR